ncbi:BatD family protein [Pseudorhodobacter sp.]|uniref:BatD family protein n=1 Tax=Pseudorhodobacter sp. TaxID=1934400 RepID=UPI00264968B6|nr:BatD family protein [Pseudorhodobacter sp.]MDN5785857.1 BatD family protein [Pseudorhodobacter sp.]
MLKHSLAVLVLIASTSAGFADGLTARISAQKLALGDTVQLVLSADPAKLTAAPDISALNADFDILGTSKSSQTQIINGARSDTVEWIITLAPRSKGHLTIPALSAGQASSAPIGIDVVDAAQMPGDQQAAGGTTITATLEPGAHYVQQEIPLSLRITTGPGFSDGAIEAPQSPDYILEQRGEDRTSQTVENGQPVTLIERDYLLRPQKSGALSIAPFTLRAMQTDPAARSPFPQNRFDTLFGGSLFGGAGSPFGQMFGGGRQITIRTAPLTLDVKAKPSAAKGWFLPAKAVTLTSQWSPVKPEFRVGEAVTRHVRIQALGATEVQLPDLAPPTVNGARVYLDKSETGSVDTADGTASVRDFSYSIVPTTGGTITLPEMTVDWFDTASETPQVASLPAETIKVEGAVVVPPATPAAPEATASASQQPPTVESQSRMTWIAGLLALLAAVLALAAFFWRRQDARADLTPGGIANAQVRREAALRSVEAACNAADPHATYAAAMKWAGAVATATGLETEAIWARFPDLSQEWKALEAGLYRTETDSTWSAKAFLSTLRSADKALTKRIRRVAQGKLPPLYPVGANRNVRETMI